MAANQIRLLQPDAALNRRQLLRRCGLGLGVLGASSLLEQSTAGQPVSASPMAPKPPHFVAKAKHVIHIFANGGPSQVDTFDPKPLLEKYAGKNLPMDNLRTERKTGAAFPSPFKFSRYGQSGLEISEIFANTAKFADEMCVVRSMHAEVPNHEPSLMLMNCGEARVVRPSMGSWVTYGLGTENQNLPGFLALCPGGYPIKETQNWQAGFLPGVYQGVHVDTKHEDAEKLIENIRNHSWDDARQRHQLDFLRWMNERHATNHHRDAVLDARIQSFELAYRMQFDASEAFDVRHEPQYVLDNYGPGVQARQLLIARRLVERGVRFVQVWHGAGQPWDDHDDIAERHRQHAQETDQAIAALLGDLKERGLLSETLVLWGGEFGRTPTVELPQAGANAGKVNGRDHNHYGFSIWMAGGGVKGGYAHGATDEFGFAAMEKKVSVHDLHATILHLMGFDHTKLTYRHAGRDFRLTDVYGEVVRDLLA